MHIWRKTPAAKDYGAAEDYLTLLFDETQARQLVHRLRSAKPVKRQAKDLLRASRTRLLEENNPHVTAELKKIRKKKKLSPVLLVRGDAKRNMPLIIADGDHRICASWHLDEDAPVACCLVDFD